MQFNLEASAFNPENVKYTTLCDINYNYKQTVR